MILIVYYVYNSTSIKDLSKSRTTPNCYKSTTFRNYMFGPSECATVLCPLLGFKLLCDSDSIELYKRCWTVQYLSNSSLPNLNPRLSDLSETFKMSDINSTRLPHLTINGIRVNVGAAYVGDDVNQTLTRGDR